LGVVFGFCEYAVAAASIATFRRQCYTANRSKQQAAMLLLLSSKISGRSEATIAPVYNSSPIKKTDSWHWQTTLKHAFPHPILPVSSVYSLTATDSADALNFVRNGPRAAC